MTQMILNMPVMLPQIVTGHRLWCETADTDERFIALEEIEFMENASTKEIWLRFYVFDDDQSRHGITHERLLLESKLSATYKQVKCDRRITDRPLLRFEQIAPIKYSGRPSDEMLNLVNTLKNQLWTIVTSITPYRRYYLYMDPAAE